MQQIAKEAGLEGMDLGRSIAYMNQQLGDEGQKGDKFREKLEAVGVATKDLYGGTRDAVDILSDLGDKLRQMPDPTERAQQAAQILGVRYRDLIPLITQGSQNLRDQIETMSASGRIRSSSCIFVC